VPVAPVSNEKLRDQLAAHEREDERRFDRLDSQLASASGKLTVLLALVVGSGALNFLAHVN
jgi:hypothetical protein